MKIMFVSAEVAPFSKVGGLGDVLGALPRAIEQEGNVCAVFTPLYGSVDCQKYNIIKIPDSELKLRFKTAEFIFTLSMCKFPNSNTNVFFVESKKYFSSLKSVYSSTVDPRLEQEKYVVFAKAVLEYARLLNFKPDIIHLNDWHTSPLCAYLKTTYKNDDFYKDSKVVFSIHNLAYQGNYFDDILEFAQLPDILSEEGKNPNKHEYRIVNWMKIAIKLADIIATVSPGYAKEIQGNEYGCGLNSLLAKRKHDIFGILNGLDMDLFNPETDNNLCKNYNFDNFNDKIESKKQICKIFKIKFDEKPIIAVIARLVEQKGYDLLINSLESIKKLDANFLILGSGEKYYENYFNNLNHKDINIKSITKYTEPVARKLFAASDFLLMPSHFEPCGITQMIAMRYGSLPLVRAIGGLENTVTGYPLNGADGFKFWRYESGDMLTCIKTALSVFKDKNTYAALVKNAMRQDFSWQKSAKEYCNIYSKAMALKNHC